MCPRWLYLIPSALLLLGGFGLMAWLTPQPRVLGGVVLDVHTLLLGALCVFLGYQTLWLWAFAKIFGWTSGLLPANTFSVRVFDHLNLERGLLAGGALLLTGLGLNGWLVLQWQQQNLGALDGQTTLRYALWGLTLMVLGVQTIYGSFFVSMLSLVPGAPRRR
jgi:hypothetical protein